MREDQDRLLKLLPGFYEQRDKERGQVLTALLRVIAEQVNIVEADIDQLYDNWFIETSQDWVVPYIGELVGYRPVHEAGEPGDITTEQGRQRNKILVPRREVANTIYYRRRKGTLALLEELANQVAGWPARAVEFYKLLLWTQSLNHQRLERGRTTDLRLGVELDRLDGPFDRLAHTVDLRRIDSPLARGRYNIPSVGVFVWRLKSYSVTETAAKRVRRFGGRCYTFSVLGNDEPLFTRPQPEERPTDIAGPFHVPEPIRRRPFEDRANSPPARYAIASADYYTENEDDPKSLRIWARDWPKEGSRQPIPRKKIIPADLRDWQYLAPPGYVVVDPELGRMVFPALQIPRKGVKVSYHYGFSADMGGGEYERTISQPNGAEPIRVETTDELRAKLAPWKANADPAKQPKDAVIEIAKSGKYSLSLNLQLGKDRSLQIRAANGKRPVICLEEASEDGFSVNGKPGSRLTLDGLLIYGQGLRVYGPQYDPDAVAPPEKDICHIVIRHCTLVPGWTLDAECEPELPNEPSLELLRTKTKVTIEDSILGSILVTADEVKTDPIEINIRDSILDATGIDCDEPTCLVLSGAARRHAHAVLDIARTTVFGRILVHAIKLGENSIFMGQVKVARRQIGCMRFSYVRPESRTPRRYRCQPDLVEDAVRAQGLAGQQLQEAIHNEYLRVRPQFNSTRYGRPTYAQLSFTCAEEIIRGADDESEMGAFHDLYQPQRAANLRARLDEYTPVAMEAGVIYET